MKKVILFLLLMPLMAADCRKRKEGRNCHYVLTIVNNSDDTIIAGTKFVHTDGGCSIDGSYGIPPGQGFDHEQTYSCWETELAEASMVYYMIQKDSLKMPASVSYPCDSIYHYNKVLKEIIVTAEGAKRNNFTYYYP